VALLALERLGTTMIDDVCVPLTRLADPTVVFDADDEDQARRAQLAFGAVMDLGLDLGGTITGEHGVGMLKKEWLAREVGSVAMRLHRDIKGVLDPQGILNPGKVFD
jgi:glycolate oxidase